MEDESGVENLEQQGGFLHFSRHEALAAFWSENRYSAALLMLWICAWYDKRAATYRSNRIVKAHASGWY
ncbi:hypothetical protein [Nitrosomonas marina]|uniref:hypothetical protein n=1 Tax=Nitrosomonas marina TaxID=917 RepID=UPI000B86BB45|nr:hypothetical protein [Nitrosomonas marina]